MSSQNICFVFAVHLVLLQELELDGDVAAQPLVLVLVDLVLLLCRVDARQGDGVPRAQVQLLQVCAVCVKLQPADSTATDSSYSRAFSTDASMQSAQPQTPLTAGLSVQMPACSQHSHRLLLQQGFQYRCQPAVSTATDSSYSRAFSTDASMQSAQPQTLLQQGFQYRCQHAVSTATDSSYSRAFSTDASMQSAQPQTPLTAGLSVQTPACSQHSHRLLLEQGFQYRLQPAVSTATDSSYNREDTLQHVVSTATVCPYSRAFSTDSSLQSAQAQTHPTSSKKCRKEFESKTIMRVFEAGMRTTPPCFGS